MNLIISLKILIILFLKTVLKSKSKKKNINIPNLELFIGTYNTSAINLNEILLSFNAEDFLFPKKFSKIISSHNLPDILCISFEEIVELNAGNIYYHQMMK